MSAHWYPIRAAWRPTFVIAEPPPAAFIDRAAMTELLDDACTFGGMELGDVLRVVGHIRALDEERVARRDAAALAAETLRTLVANGLPPEAATGPRVLLKLDVPARVRLAFHDHLTPTGVVQVIVAEVDTRP